MRKRKNLLFFLFFIRIAAGCGLLFARTQIIPFHHKSFVENVDYHSFSALMLKHQIGNDFRKLPKNPVLAPSRGNWDAEDTADPFVLVTADSIMLFYDGDNSDRYHIGYAVQDEHGWGWKKRGRFITGSKAAWDSYHQIAPVVLLHEGTWLLFYNGNINDSELGYQWGLARKIFGQHNWQYPPGLPLMALDSASWDFAGNAYGDILYFPEENKFKMWYTGFQGPLASIGMAESTDGLNWQKIGEGAVLVQLPGVISPDVIYNGEMYYMYFVQLQVSNKGMGTKICRAKSKGGIHWENIEDVLLPGGGWEGRRLMRPNLSFFDGRVQLYYCASGGSTWRIGAAYAVADFTTNKGIWRSKPLKTNFRKVRIKYKVPAETSLTVNFVDMLSGKIYETNLEAEKVQLRNGVFLSVIPIPQELSSVDRQIELKLMTSSPNKSPVVYELSLGE
jgi:predicted GH43/DUF377 family glycosyl hydrolase